MKKSFLLLLILGYGLKMSAQTNPNSTELIIGTNQYWADSNIPWIPGITAGISQKIGFTKAIGLNFELLFVNYKIREVFEQEYFGVSTKSVTRTSLNTVKVPVLLNFGKNKNISVGIMYGFNLGGKYKSESTTIQRNTPPETTKDAGTISFKESFIAKDFDFVFGFGKTTNKFTWELRPTLSLLYIGENFRNGIIDADGGAVSLHFLLKYKLK